MLADHPRIRGEHLAPPRHKGCVLWIIPAYAGSTATSGAKTACVSDHPRIRGEHREPAGLVRGEGGSSPHTRGAPHQVKITFQTIGIIPAYAGSTLHDAPRPQPQGDHPRIRGEHTKCSLAPCWRRGSSPHTRGAQHILSPAHGVGRIIPAYAGSTAGYPLCRLPSWDHPRIRGEHKHFSRKLKARVGSSPHTRGALVEALLSVELSRIIPAYAGSTMGAAPWERDDPGSSPHTRGALECRTEAIDNSRIIPAYAGSTTSSRRPAAGRGDHPRIRGEHGTVLGDVRPRDGSSPHTRGAQRRICAPVGAVRIIPAYAGSTRRHHAMSGAVWIIPAYAGSTRGRWTSAGLRADHPRIRGEHRHGTGPSSPSPGSSPHTRGALRQTPVQSVERRIIPAYAGSTAPTTPRTTPRPDHPRIRGEHHHHKKGQIDMAGSSPHTRGALRIGATCPMLLRIIPAYAGSTPGRRVRVERLQDHPRIRGEHPTTWYSVIPANGSSPHTRGAQLRPMPERVGLGIIPAYAGSTLLQLRLHRRKRDHPRIRGEHTWKSLQYQGSPP